MIQPKRAPKRLYWVELTTIGELKFRQKGGGKFTSLEAAENRQWHLQRQGIESEIYETVCDWRKVEDE